MKCVPYGEPGPHWRGFVQFAPGSFTDSLASIVGKDTKAYIAADAHRLNPTDLLANSLSNAPQRHSNLRRHHRWSICHRGATEH